MKLAVRRRHLAVSTAIACALVILLSGCATTWRGRPPIYDNPRVSRVAVLAHGNDFFADTLTALLVNNSRWQIIDRAHLQAIIREQDRQQNWRFDDATAVRIGRLAGVDVVVMSVYYGNSASVKAIDVQTARYLAFQTYQFPAHWDVGFKAQWAASALLPYKMKYRRTDGWGWILLGPNADKQ